jgi:hypothetical protein
MSRKSWDGTPVGTGADSSTRTSCPALPTENSGQEWFTDLREFSWDRLANLLELVLACPVRRSRAWRDFRLEAWPRVLGAIRVLGGILIGDDASGPAPQWPSYSRTWRIPGRGTTSPG